MSLAPIILFVYNRPSHTLKTLEALAANQLASESVLYIFADGAKENATETTLRKINETRDIVKSKQWCKETYIIERTENFGLAKSVIEGVTSTLDKYKKIIVLEDDLVTSKHFLKFMNEALDRYENEDNVACISAYIYPIENLPELFFIKGADCWGWATWKRSWNLFEADGKKLLSELESQDKTYEFNFNNTYPYTKMLEEQIKGINNSWAIRWYASAFLKNKLCLYPGKTYVSNIGLDGSGENSGNQDIYKTTLNENPVNWENLTAQVDKTAFNMMANYFKSLNLVGPQPSFQRRLLKKIIPHFLISLYRKLKY